MQRFVQIQAGGDEAAYPLLAVTNRAVGKREEVREPVENARDRVVPDLVEGQWVSAEDNCDDAPVITQSPEAGSLYTNEVTITVTPSRRFLARSASKNCARSSSSCRSPAS